jgi:chloramphenicol-sensitive protein RarD
VRSLPLTTIGLMQFITPSCQLAIALAVFHEPLTRAQGVAFPIIWAALALYVLDAVRHSRRSPAPAAVEPVLGGS